MDHNEILDVFSEDVLHAILDGSQGSSELSLHDPNPRLEVNQVLQSDKMSTPCHASAWQEARKEQQMDAPDPAHQ